MEKWRLETPIRVATDRENPYQDWKNKWIPSSKKFTWHLVNDRGSKWWHGIPETSDVWFPSWTPRFIAIVAILVAIYFLLYLLTYYIWFLVNEYTAYSCWFLSKLLGIFPCLFNIGGFPTRSWRGLFHCFCGLGVCMGTRELTITYSAAPNKADVCLAQRLIHHAETGAYTT